jgi:hypothetical protein
MLLYPERGLELNKTAMEIVRLCTGDWTVDDIARCLTQIYVGVPSGEIRRQVHDFLDALAGRGLLQDMP